MRILPTCWLVLLSLTACGQFSSREHYVERGARFFEQGKLEDAALQFRKALQKDPNYGEAYYRLGLTDKKRGQERDAFAAFLKAVELPSPQQDAARVELADLALSGYLSDSRRPEVLFKTADRMADELLARNKQSHDGLRLRGNLAMAAGNPKSAVAFFQQADQAKPDQPQVVISMVQAMLLDNQDQAAETRALQFLGKQPKSATLYDILYGHYRRSNRLPDAESILKKKISNNPDQPFFVTQLAEFYWTTNRQKDAEALLAAMPVTPENYQEIGDLYGRLRLWDKATAAYQQGLGAKPGEDKSRLAPLRQRLVGVFLRQGKNAEAAKVLDEILRENPGDSEAVSARASLRMATGDPQETSTAVAEFRKLIEKEPRNAGHHYQLSRALRDRGQADEARKVLQQVLKLDPQHREALGDLAAMAIAAEDASTALEYAQRSLALEPRDPRVRLVRTAAWALQGQFKQVRQDLVKLTQEFPGLAEPQIQMGLLEIAEQRYDQAARIFQQQYKPGSADIRPLKGLAEVAFARNQPEQAFALVDQEYRRAAKPSQALLELAASTADRAGRSPAAIEAFEKLVAQYPPRPSDLVRLGQLVHGQGQTAKAVEVLERARQLAPKDAAVPAVLGAVFSASGKWDDAVRCYRESLALNPSDPAVMNNLSYALAERGNSLEEALKLAQAAVEKAPQQPEFTDTLGYVYLKRNQFDSAIQTYRSVVSRTGTAQSRMRLASALSAKGEKQQARSELESALKANPTATDAAAIREMLSKLR